MDTDIPLDLHVQINNSSWPFSYTSFGSEFPFAFRYLHILILYVPHTKHTKVIFNPILTHCSAFMFHSRESMTHLLNIETCVTFFYNPESHVTDAISKIFPLFSPFSFYSFPHPLFFFIIAQDNFISSLMWLSQWPLLVSFPSNTIFCIGTRIVLPQYISYYSYTIIFRGFNYWLKK